MIRHIFSVVELIGALRRLSCCGRIIYGEYSVTFCYELGQYVIEKLQSDKNVRYDLDEYADTWIDAMLYITQ
jgi:hypothetical protein